MFRKQHGQSLTEVAIFLPIFLILLAGIVEISQLTITKNKVVTAARVASGFGANGGEDDGMIAVTLHSITQTLKLEESDWDIWTIRGKINSEGNNFQEFEFTHNYGISNTQLFSNVTESDIQMYVWDQLRKDDNGQTIPQSEEREKLGDLRFVGIYIIHDINSILELNSFPALANITSVKALSIMRVTGLQLEPTNGCTAFPIGIDENIRSIDDIPLQNAKEGYRFKVERGIRFDWLLWNNIYLTGTKEDLTHSLGWRGDSIQYPTYGYYEPGDPTDTSLNIKDWVLRSSALTTDAREVVEDHVAQKRTLQLIIWGDKSGDQYQISRFGVFRILDHNLDEGWLLLEFINWNDSCGQIIP